MEGEKRGRRGWGARPEGSGVWHVTEKRREQWTIFHRTEPVEG